MPRTTNSSILKQKEKYQGELFRAVPIKSTRISKINSCFFTSNSKNKTSNSEFLLF